jgi:hypothetical protein
MKRAADEKPWNKKQEQFSSDSQSQRSHDVTFIGNLGAFSVIQISCAWLFLNPYADLFMKWNVDKSV